MVNWQDCMKQTSFNCAQTIHKDAGQDFKVHGLEEKTQNIRTINLNLNKILSNLKLFFNSQLRGRRAAATEALGKKK